LEGLSKLGIPGVGHAKVEKLQMGPEVFPQLFLATIFQ
jgi:hypothetical protein